jgi:hypothetical protein
MSTVDVLDLLAEAEARYCLGETAAFQPMTILVRSPFAGFLLETLLAGQSFETQSAIVRAAGFAGLAEFADRIWHHDLTALTQDAADFLDRTRARYDAVRGRRACTLTQLIHAVRATFADPVDLATCVPLLHRTVAALGLELAPRVRLDLTPRPGKVPGAYCLPIRIPEEIVVAVSERGGVSDCRPLFHEAGHALHFSYTSAGLPAESRRFGDPGLVEGWGVVTENLFLSEPWLNRSFPARTAAALARDTARRLLIVIRAQCVRLLYAVEAVRRPAAATAQRYQELMTDHLGAQAGPGEHATVLCGRFASATRLRSWRFGWAVAALLSSEFGADWPAGPRAGSWLTRCWATGTSCTEAEAVRRWGLPEPGLRRVADDLDRLLGGP